MFSYVGNSDPTYVRCKYEGYPTPWVVMTFDGKLKSNATGTAEIEVTTDAIKYFGDYKCYAHNKFGWTNRTVTMETASMKFCLMSLRRFASVVCNVWLYDLFVPCCRGIS